MNTTRRQKPHKHQKLMGVKPNDGFGGADLRAPKSKVPPAKKPPVKSRGDFEVNHKQAGSIGTTEERILALVDRDSSFTTVMSKNGSETVTKNEHEVISCYKTEDGTEDTKEDKPCAQVDKRVIVQLVTFKGKVRRESLIERTETFTVAGPDEDTPEEPIRPEPEEPMNDNKTADEESNHLSESSIEETEKQQEKTENPDSKTGDGSSQTGIREAVSVEMLESVLEVRQKELSKEAEESKPKSAKKAKISKENFELDTVQIVVEKYYN